MESINIKCPVRGEIKSKFLKNKNPYFEVYFQSPQGHKTNETFLIFEVDRMTDFCKQKNTTDVKIVFI